MLLCARCETGFVTRKDKLHCEKCLLILNRSILDLGSLHSAEDLFAVLRRAKIPSFNEAPTLLRAVDSSWQVRCSYDPETYEFDSIEYFIYRDKKLDFWEWPECRDTTLLCSWDPRASDPFDRNLPARHQVKTTQQVEENDFA